MLIQFTNSNTGKSEAFHTEHIRYIVPNAETGGSTVVFQSSATITKMEIEEDILSAYSSNSQYDVDMLLVTPYQYGGVQRIIFVNTIHSIQEKDGEAYISFQEAQTKLRVHESLNDIWMQQISPQSRFMHLVTPTQGSGGQLIIPAYRIKRIVEDEDGNGSKLIMKAGNGFDVDEIVADIVLQQPV